MRTFTDKKEKSFGGDQGLDPVMVLGLILNHTPRRVEEEVSTSGNCATPAHANVSLYFTFKMLKSYKYLIHRS